MEDADCFFLCDLRRLAGHLKAGTHGFVAACGPFLDLRAATIEPPSAAFA
jgi:hypothetical protein